MIRVKVRVKFRVLSRHRSENCKLRRRDFQVAQLRKSRATFTCTKRLLVASKSEALYGDNYAYCTLYPIVSYRQMSTGANSEDEEIHPSTGICKCNRPTNF